MKRLWMVLSLTPFCSAQEFEDTGDRVIGDEDKVVIDIQPEEETERVNVQESLRKEDIQRIVSNLLEQRRSKGSSMPSRAHDDASYMRITRALKRASKSKEFKDSLSDVIESLRDSFGLLVAKMSNLLNDTDRKKVSNLLTRFGRVLERVKENPEVLQQKALRDTELQKDMQDLQLEFLTEIVPALSVLQQEEQKKERQGMQTKHTRKVAEFFLDVVNDAQEILERSNDYED